MSAAGRLQTEGTNKISGVVIKEHIVKKGGYEEWELVTCSLLFAEVPDSGNLADSLPH